MDRIRKIVIYCLMLLGAVACSQEDDAKKLNIYNWVGAIDPSIIQDFEKETGITVVYDVYESNDVLEAKILTGHSGYDLVFPSFYPYFARQKEAGVYTKLDKSKIPNWSLLDPDLVSLIDRISEGSDYCVPYSWSITGIGYRADLVKKYMPNAPVNSLRMLYDKNVLKQLSKCGIGYLEEAVDVIPLTLYYLGLPPDSQNETDINAAVQLLLTLRPYIRQMASTRPGEDLVTGDMCVTQNWLSVIAEIQSRGDSMKNPPDIRFSIPEEGTSMWLDVMAIPIDARHKDNAYKFINFMLRPENMARITNTVYFFNPVPSSEPYIKKEVKDRLNVIDARTRQKLFHTRVVSKDHIKKLTRAIQRVVSGR